MKIPFFKDSIRRKPEKKEREKRNKEKEGCVTLAVQMCDLVFRFQLCPCCHVSIRRAVI